MRHCRFELTGEVRDGIATRRSGRRPQSWRSPRRSEEVRLLAPVQPRKFLGIGLNYADHIAESGMEAPEFPVFFNKQSTCVVGPGDDVHMPRVSSLLDYEGELAIVIGSAAGTSSEEHARGGDRRLHDHERPLGARLAAAHADDDARASRSTPTARSGPGS